MHTLTFPHFRRRNVADPGICYCGAYGGGVHTKSARCDGSPEPEPPAPLASNEQLSELYTWLLDTSNESSPYESQMLTRAAAVVGEKLLSIANAALQPAVETTASPTDAQIDEFVSGLMGLFCVGDMVKTPYTMEAVAREMMRGWLAGFQLKTTPVHPDPTGTTREPPHCPTCGCGVAP
jgi:hypothetical protein